MFALRFASLAVVAVVFGTTSAAPTRPAYGEIVHVAPEHTSGNSVGTGGGTAHPHINMGPAGGSHYSVAPVTHGGADHLRPYMATPENEHGLGGNTRLDPVTAHHSSIQRSRGSLRGAIMPAAGMHDIHEAQGLVQDHRTASHAHASAANAHRIEQSWHDGQSAHHFQHGNAADGAYHSGQSAIHAGHAANHDQASANHYHAANNVSGPNHQERLHAQNSAAHANAVHTNIHQAGQHDGYASHAANAGDHAGAAHHNQAAANLRHSANQYSASSMTHHNAATGHHL